eukprot:CAMPEP_0181188262 /NCGR_PEP_ID=MMETSP1096-20121128/11017_1 /TAXON_ID=156174 ORGANISM="Chrysochromulina ericina, Strain CCMP281" /NCGR_SAMPLE_ID=MMETSP1096 /ASSEMBLY_ACC=CAM_ASM_000453 /LENGTH=86 /DNA_ID=CAMNT_0023277301 /DNA_START=256 /DNA_END=517 /DNA_ORIENTATION=+
MAATGALRFLKTNAVAPLIWHNQLATACPTWMAPIVTRCSAQIRQQLVLPVGLPCLKLHRKRSHGSGCADANGSRCDCRGQIEPVQ